MNTEFKEIIQILSASLLLATGKGIAPNRIEAYKWIELAKSGSALDKIAAVETQERLITFMSPEQIAEGKMLSNAFIPRKSKP